MSDNKYPTVFEILAVARRSKLTLFLDEHLHHLREPLRALGFKVKILEKGLQDPEVQHEIQGDVLITKNIRDFKTFAVRFDFDLIDISAIRFEDKQRGAENITAQKIANAISRSSFSQARGNFCLVIYDDGSYKIELIS